MHGFLKNRALEHGIINARHLKIRKFQRKNQAGKI